MAQKRFNSILPQNMIYFCKKGNMHSTLQKFVSLKYQIKRSGLLINK